MNKIAVKAAAVCLSAAMFSAAVLPSVSLSNDSVKNSVVYAEAGKELITTPGCENLNGYGLYLAGGADAELSSKDGALVVDIKDVGKLNYGVQLNHAIIPLYKNGVYELSYRIRCDVPRYTECLIQMDGGDYTSYVWTECDVTTEWQTVTKKFEMEYDSDICGKLCFNMGNQEKDGALGAHKFYVDEISVKVVDDSKVDYTVFEAEETPIVANQIGYLPSAKKTAVLRGDALSAKKFSVCDASGKEVFSGDVPSASKDSASGDTCAKVDFSSVNAPGTYYIKCGELKSYEFKIDEDVYNDLLDESVYMLYTQRCGTAVKGEVVNHPACHTGMATVYGTGKKIDVTGGWHDAGDYGRYVVPAAKSVADLFIAYGTNKSLFSDKTGIPESGNGVADILDEARYELEWMLKMQDKETGGVYHKVSCSEFPGFVAPEEETNELIVTPVSTTATADFCGAMAMGYEYFLSVDKTFADKCLDAAKSAYTYLEGHPNYELVNPKEITTGDYADFDKVDKDERYWAACQMFRATGDSKYESDINKYGVQTGLGWAEMGEYGTFAYLTMDSAKQNADIKSRMEASVLKQANTYAGYSNGNAYGDTLAKYFWGCNMDVANHGMLLDLADKIDSSKGYKETAAEQLNYLLGRNALGNCFVTGFGTVGSSNPHHRPSVVYKKCVPGMLVGGPDSALEDNTAKAYLADAAPAKCYIDNADSYSTNEVTIYWNSPLTALIADVLTAKSETPDEPEVTTPVVTTPAVTETEPVQTTVSETVTTPAVTTTEEAVVTTEASLTTKTDEEDFMLGDIDDNGIVDVTDLSYASLYVMHERNLTEKQLKAADVDRDGRVILADVARLVQFITKTISKF